MTVIISSCNIDMLIMIIISIIIIIIVIIVVNNAYTGVCEQIPEIVDCIDKLIPASVKHIIPIL